MASRFVTIKSVEEFLKLHEAGLAMWKFGSDRHGVQADARWGLPAYLPSLKEWIDAGMFVYLVEEDESPIT